MNIYQHLDELRDSDGVGNDAIGLHKEFNQLGWNSNFITRIPRKGNIIEGAKFHSIFDTLRFNTNDIHLLHYGGHGYPLDLFRLSPGKKILRFHNITPSHYYQNSTTPEIYSSMNRFESLSYLEISTLGIICDAAWCDSPFNAHVLQAFDFKMLKVLPICKKYEVYLPPRSIKQSYNLCFVGRYAPQKKWEDLILFFSHWRKKHSQAHLFCIGSVIGAFDGYYARLKKLVKDLDLEDYVLFLNHLSDSEVLQKLSESSALVSMSEHEGFCLPLLEAFGVGIPVFAYDAGATKTTMNQAGRVFSEKNFPKLVDMISDELSNNLKIENMINQQYNSLKYYNEFPWHTILPYLVSLL